MRHDFVDEGQGPPLLLLHGLVPGPSVFDDLRGALAPTHRLLIPSLPGYGHTPPIVPPYTVADTLSLLVADLLAFDVRQLKVVGLSAGGHRALQLALSSSLEVTHVVTLAGYANLEPAHREGLRQLAALALSGGDVGVAAASNFSPRYAAAHPTSVARLRAELVAIPPSVLAAELEAAASGEDLRPRLRGVRARVTARAGDSDTAMPIERAREVAAGVERGTLELVKGAGHSLLEEDFEATVASIRRGLA